MQGKLDSIKSIGELLPSIDAQLKQCGGARAQLEELLGKLTRHASSIAQSRESEILREQKQKEYADLIKQRQTEREEAERKVDERTQTRLRETKPKEPTITNPTPVISPNRVQYPSQTQTARPAPQAWSSGRTFPPREQNSYGNRPQGQGYQGNRPQGTFQQGQRPSGTFGQGTRPQGQGYQGNRPQGTFQGPRPAFGNRPQGQGFTPRPQTPRPAGGAPRSPLGGVKPTEKFVPKVDTFSGKKRVKSFDNSEKTGMDKRTLMRRGMIEEQEIEERMLTRIFRTKKSKDGNETQKEQSNVVIINTHLVSVKTLSEKIGKPVTEIIKQLMVLGSMCNINSNIDFDTASLVAGEFGFVLQLDVAQTGEEKLKSQHRVGDEDEGKLEVRPPVVTVLGHVDHGKTSLLDKIRQSNVQAKEHGGITQHIGAYQVKCKDKKITFIDTPGHAAFEKMRARGASFTDIAILLVAGDDGVMPQTIEAIKHIKKHKLPMIVAVNKMDKKESNMDRVKEQLATHDVLSEDWGGDAIMVPVSAMTGMGIDKLLEMIILVADVNGYKANPQKSAQGVIIDGRKDATIGGIVNLLIQSGTLRVGDTLLAGTCHGKVRKITDDKGKAIKSAGPSTPVQVLGFTDIPKAGDACYVVDEKLTKEVVSERKDKAKREQTKSSTKIASDIDAIARLDVRAKKQLNLIIKGDVSGSLEAIIQTIKTITSDEVNINIISSGVGAVNENDVNLAEVSNALLIAFHVKSLVKKTKVKIHEFKVIYQIFDFVTEQMVRQFTPKYNEVYHGSAEVRQMFKSSAIGQIAGCMVKDGKVIRGEKVKLMRADKLVGEYVLGSLKIVKDDAKEVAKGFECGIKLDGNVELAVGDIIQCIGKEQQPIIYNGRKYEF